MIGCGERQPSHSAERFGSRRFTALDSLLHLGVPLPSPRSEEQRQEGSVQADRIQEGATTKLG